MYVQQDDFQSFNLLVLGESSSVANKPTNDLESYRPNCCKLFVCLQLLNLLRLELD